MERDRHEYRGHIVELRLRKRSAADSGDAERQGEVELLIDEQPVRYGQLPDGSYYLDEYAYDWQEDLSELAHRFIDYQERTGKGPGGSVP